MVLLNNLQSYFMRHDLSMAFLVPLITIFVFFIFYTAVVKIPLVWSLIVTILGYAVFAVIQTVLILTLIGSIEKVQRDLATGWLLQFATGIVAIFLSNLLYRLGWGFKFDFEKLRLRFEDILIVFLIGLSLLCISILFIYIRVMFNGVFFALIMVLFLYYAIRRERE